MQGLTAYGKYPFGNLIYLDQQVCVQLLKLRMQFKKLIAFDVPVKTANVLIKNHVVGQKIVQGCCCTILCGSGWGFRFHGKLFFWRNIIVAHYTKISIMKGAVARWSDGF